MALPASILVVGGGVFGLSTCVALAARHSGSITLLDAAPIPNPHGSSVDSSRILRADYAAPAYARLAAAALHRWRHSPWGLAGRHHRNGLVLLAAADNDAYLRKSHANVRDLNPAVVELLSSPEDVRRVLPSYGGDLSGYVNWDSAWGNAEAGVRYARELLDQTSVIVRRGTVKRLIYSGQKDGRDRVVGVRLEDGQEVLADLVVLATGAWTGSLVDLRGRAEATGHLLVYLPLTDAEQRALHDMPTVLNFADGTFVIPPRDNELKVGRHAYGYRNPVTIPHPVTGEEIEVSLPLEGASVPGEGQRAARAALKQLLPALAERPFSRTRICWYTDTKTGDFIICYHPQIDGLFLATGGSGHGYKFLPVLGDKIVDAMQGTLDADLAACWGWPEAVDGPVFTADGSRSGTKGMVLSVQSKI